MTDPRSSDDRDRCLDATAERMPVDAGPAAPVRRRDPRHDAARARAIRATLATVVAGLAVLLVVGAILNAG